MNVGLIDQTQWPLFAPLLLPLVTTAVERGEAVVVLGLTEDDVACGAAAYYMEGTRMQVLSLYVAPDYRERGGGSTLLLTLSRLARNAPTPASEMALDFSVTHEEHETLVRFLEHMGYQKRPTQDGNHYYMTLGQMIASPYYKPTKRLPEDVIPLRRLDDMELHALRRRAVKSGVFVPVNQLNDPEVEPDVSCAIVKGDIPIAFLLFSFSGERLTLRCSWDREHQATHIPKMLLYAMAQLTEKYPPETPMAVDAESGSCEELVLKLVPDAQPISVCYYRPFY